MLTNKIRQILKDLQWSFIGWYLERKVLVHECSRIISQAEIMTERGTPEVLFNRYKKEMQLELLDEMIRQGRIVFESNMELGSMAQRLKMRIKTFL